MHEWGNSGITAVLLALCIAVLISLGVAQQARARAARYQEIRKLQFVAAEEARRAEEQADAEYTSMVARTNCCAVCLNPTTTRCSRCKTVRYCSSTCQGQHWRQGHKQECRAPDGPSGGISSTASLKISDTFNGESSVSQGQAVPEVSDLPDAEEALRPELARLLPVGRTNGTVVKAQKILFPYEYFVQYFNWNKLRLPPCGLINCGNSCFANVVLQCLTYTRPLTAYLLEGHHAEGCRRNEWCFMCELQFHVERVRQSQNPFSPIKILSRIRNIGNHLGYGRQEDAHEFMRFAIDSMQSICLDEAGGEKSLDPRSQETTFINHIFGGHLQSQVRCMQCLHESNRYENMMDLAVEIHGFVETLEDALAQFTAHECLDGENKYKCDWCNAYVEASKRLTVHEAPNILTIALKRFQSGKFGKLNKRVTFPDVLNMSPYMSGKSDKPPLYQLYAVVVHVDMLNASFFGHYICYVKDLYGTWYKVDDSKVKEVELEKVMSQRAYMLFYSRSSVRVPSECDDKGIKISTNTNPFHLQRPILSTDEFQSSFEVSSTSSFVPVGDVAIATSGTLGVFGDNEIKRKLGDGNGSSYVTFYPSGTTSVSQKQTSRIWESEPSCADMSDSESLSLLENPIMGGSASHSATSPSSSKSIKPSSKQSQFSELSCEQDTSSPSFFPPSHLSVRSIAKEQPGCEASVKIAKRRLNTGLTPLPIPKPLDIDLLPAWPVACHGRSSSCPAGFNLAHPIYCHSPELSVLQQHNNIELPSPSSSLQRLPKTGGARFSPDHKLEENLLQEDKQYIPLDPERKELALDESSCHSAVATDNYLCDSVTKLSVEDMPTLFSNREKDGDLQSNPSSVQKQDQNSRAHENCEGSLHNQAASSIQLVVDSKELIVENQFCYPQTLSPDLILEQQTSATNGYPSCEPGNILSMANTTQGAQISSKDGCLMISENSPEMEPLVDKCVSTSEKSVTLSVSCKPQHIGSEEPVNAMAAVKASQETVECKAAFQNAGFKIAIKEWEGDSLGVPLLGKTQKRKQSLKPLYTPGFLNSSMARSSLLKARNWMPKSQDVEGNDVFNLQNLESTCENASGIQNTSLSQPHTKKQGKVSSDSPSISRPADCRVDSQGSMSGSNEIDLRVNHSQCGEGNVNDDGDNTIGATPSHASASIANRIVELASKPQVSLSGIEEQVVRNAVVVQTHPGLAGSGKQKQGRNESCACGSQRKWKKCCGKVDVIKPEAGGRRLVV